VSYLCYVDRYLVNIETLDRNVREAEYVLTVDRDRYGVRPVLDSY
jgi:hypothetical protein